MKRDAEINKERERCWEGQRKEEREREIERNGIETRREEDRDIVDSSVFS